MIVLNIEDNFEKTILPRFRLAGTSTPMRRIFSGCCARAASGHAAAPLRKLMKSRRLM